MTHPTAHSHDFCMTKAFHDTNFLSALCFQVIMIQFRALSFLRKGLMRLHSMLEPLDLVTGLEKRELLAYLGGKCDPFNIMPIKRGT